MAEPAGPEACEAAIAAVLLTGLPAALDTIWATWTTPPTVPVVPELYPEHVYVGQVDMLPEFPSVVVVATDSQIVSDGAPVWNEMEHHIEIVAFCVADTRDTLNRMTQRYLWAIRNVIMQNQNLGGAISGISGVALDRSGRSAVYKNAAGLLQQEAAWRVTVNVLESL